MLLNFNIKVNLTNNYSMSFQIKNNLNFILHTFIILTYIFLNYRYNNYHSLNVNDIPIIIVVLTCLHFQTIIFK